MDAPPELEGRLVMQAEKEPAWASGPGLEEPGRAEPETFRRCFRQLCYQDVSGPREAFSKLWELCCRWLRPEVRSKQQILELLVIEQFLTILPEKMRAWAQTRRPGSGEEAVALVTHLEKEAGRLRQQVGSPGHSEKRAPPAAAWDAVDFQPQSQPKVLSREGAGSLHAGHRQPLSQKREHQPSAKDACPFPWVPAPAGEWDTTDQEGTATRLPVGSQEPQKDVHMARGSSCRKRMRQVAAHRGLHQDLRKDGAGNVASPGSAESPSNKRALSEPRKEPWAAGLQPSDGRTVLRSGYIREKSAGAGQLPARNVGRTWREQQQWGLEDEKVAGVHWSYEETKTFLAILRESRFYETLQACPRNSQVYGAVAEWLRACGFLRTPEQCRTKFKSLQKSYRRARSGHMLEPCAFFEDMDALLNPAAHASSPGKSKAAVSLPSLQGSGLGAEGRIGLLVEEGAAGDSDEEESSLEFIRKPEVRGAPVLFQNLSGVHWGYEETKTFLDILRETRFYEALQACHRKSKLYGAVAEQLRACGFLRTPEQCRTKFKSLQKSYRRVRSGHVLEPCAFYKEMDALINARAPVPSPSRPERQGPETEPQEPPGWELEETAQEAVGDDCGGKRTSEEGTVLKSDCRGSPGPLQSPRGFEIGGRMKEDAMQVICEDMEQHRPLLGKSKRVVTSQNSDPGRCRKRESISGRQWEALQGTRPPGKLGAQPRDLGKALVPPRPFPGRRPYRLLKYGDSSGRGARLLCRATHQKENPHQCAVCGKRFGGSRSLTRHQRAHTGERPLKCPDCGKSFQDASNLGAHQRSHTAGKLYPCGDCGKGFPSSSHLSAHRSRVHAGESPYKCVDCEKSFGTCARFREPRRAHTGDRPHACALCGKRFSKSSVLGKHRETHGREKPPPPPPGPPPEAPQKGKSSELRKTF
ncbi:PREDICTED: zinc finger protein with KRAB and SCAN domains 2 [Hipposideros armiger]|uniref:Zinc finger protein with KRAB and SCAN domains 2 n=1 Tax=Hipposideros armiger TaxID=186990 RepID=A0A8B7RW60_HIPAR|nr:PREDICTED: zinc finger protein with KRAB and SCAN domains 2 [Hipposideros armiger]